MCECGCSSSSEKTSLDVIDELDQEIEVPKNEDLFRQYSMFLQPQNDNHDVTVHIDQDNGAMIVNMDNYLVFQVGESRLIMTPDHIQLISKKIFLN